MNEQNKIKKDCKMNYALYRGDTLAASEPKANQIPKIRKIRTKRNTC